MSFVLLSSIWVSAGRFNPLFCYQFFSGRRCGQEKSDSKKDGAGDVAN